LNKAELPPIGPDLPWLAPLAGHTDLPFRLICREQGAAAACTEMISAKGLVYGERSSKGPSATRRLLRTTPLPAFPEAKDDPLVVQLFGDDSYFLGEAAALLVSWGCRHFDFNLGCPAPKVLKGGAGGALARDTRKAVQAAEAVMRAVAPRPMGCKLRLGWNPAEENYLELGAELARSGASWLSLHPRHVRQGFGGRADWSAVARLKDRVDIPVLASGDLSSADAGLRCLRQSRADGLLFARGALHNPAIFGEFRGLCRQYGGPDVTAGPEEASAGDKTAAFQETARNLRGIVLRHIALARAVDGDRAFPRLRGAVLGYIRGLPGHRALRQDLNLCSGWDMLEDALEKYFTRGGLCG